jgi:hypothetical protein
VVEVFIALFVVCVLLRMQATNSDSATPSSDAGPDSDQSTDTQSYSSPFLAKLATPQDWALNYQPPASMNIPTPVKSARNY